MKKIEGFQERSVARTQPRADTGPETLSHGQQKVHLLASAAFGRRLGTPHSPEQIGPVARSAAAVATENSERREVQGCS